MNSEYIITPHELALKGLNLNDLVNDETFVFAITEIALDLIYGRIYELCDEIKFDSDIEELLDKEPRLVPAFKRLQYRVIYGLVNQNETNPLDSMVDSIISQQLRFGKINSIQKGRFYRYN